MDLSKLYKNVIRVEQQSEAAAMKSKLTTLTLIRISFLLFFWFLSLTVVQISRCCFSLFESQVGRLNDFSPSLAAGWFVHFSSTRHLFTIPAISIALCGKSNDDEKSMDSEWGRRNFSTATQCSTKSSRWSHCARVSMTFVAELLTSKERIMNDNLRSSRVTLWISPQSQFCGVTLSCWAERVCWVEFESRVKWSTRWVKVFVCCFHLAKSSSFSVSIRILTSSQLVRTSILDSIMRSRFWSVWTAQLSQ